MPDDTVTLSLPRDDANALITWLGGVALPPAKDSINGPILLLYRQLCVAVNQERVN